MVVMRVYAVEAQCSMQRCLRDAVKNLGLHDGSPEENRLFSVMFDNGRDKNSLMDIEPYFLQEFNLLDSGAGESYFLTDRLKELYGHNQSPTASLSYADLLNVPMILILVDKGRTGDTFPHSLGYFDLRIRTVDDSYSTFEQELGRLCRYQTFRRIDAGEIAGCSKDSATKLGEEVSFVPMEQRREGAPSPQPTVHMHPLTIFASRRSFCQSEGTNTSAWNLRATQHFLAPGKSKYSRT